jgi:hypothetical protein
LVNKIRFRIRHVAGRPRFYPAAFIFDEWSAAWLIDGVPHAPRDARRQFGVNPMLNRICLKLMIEGQGQSHADSSQTFSYRRSFQWRHADPGRW